LLRTDRAGSVRREPVWISITLCRIEVCGLFRSVSKDVHPRTERVVLSSQAVHKQTFITVNFGVFFGWNQTLQSRLPAPFTKKESLVDQLVDLRI